MLSLTSLLLVASSLFQISHSASTPLPPSKDPFYTAPANYDLAAPGTILRLRSAPGNLTRVISNSSAAYNILYRTTDSRYQPAWAVTTLFVPLTAPGNSTNGTEIESPLLSYQIPYDSANVDESPSYTLYSGASSGDIKTALSMGWYVNVPDYEGPLASFTAGVQSGHATLDSVRAVLSSGFGLSPTARYAMWGYSGGALASEWAAELQLQYAPELNFSGAALGGLTPNVTSVIMSVEGGLAAGLVPQGIVGITSQYPEAYAYILDQLKDTGKDNETTFISVRNITFNAALEEFALNKLEDFFVDGFAALQNPLVQKIVSRDGLMGYHGVPQMPIYAYKAIGDQVSNITDTDKLIDRFCGVGVNILYQRNKVGGHTAESTNGRPAALSWLMSVLNGTYAENYKTEGCMIENVTVNITSLPLR